MLWPLLLILSFSLEAAWSTKPKQSALLDLNPIKFSNRSRCALDSNKPTQSILFLSDTMDVGKALFRAADILRLTDEFTSQGVIRFRYTLFSIAKIVAKKILSGELPLLNADYNSYQAIIKNCPNGCRDLDDLVSRAWSGVAYGEYEKFEKQLDPGARCYSIKNFDGLYPHLSSTNPTKETLEEIAKSVHNYADLVKTCEENLVEDVRGGIYQLDLDISNQKEWELKGFDFWSSFNIYLSWAFRHSPEAKQLALNYYKIFKQTNIEELTLFFSNGCKSMSNPECSKDYLNTNSLREFAKIDQTAELSKLDVFSLSPDRPPRSAIDNTELSHHDDLGIKDHDDAILWAANFNDNLAKTRGYLKFKLSQGLSTMKLIKNGIGESFELRLMQYFQNAHRINKTDIKLQELYIACSEFKVSQDKDLSFLREEINQIQKYTDLWNYSSNINNEVQEQLSWFLNQISPKFLKLCKDLDQASFWDHQERPANQHFSPWYQQYVFGKLEKKDKELELGTGEYFSIKNNQTSSVEVICKTPVSCARKVLDSIIGLKLVSDHASGILALNSQFKTPQLTSPISEKAVCQAYDPWRQSKKLATDLLQNILLAGVSTAVITPIYLDFSVTDKKVTSLEEIIKDGKVFYNPQFDKKSLQKSLIMDFGPLIGAPCAIGISGEDKIRPPTYLAFNGITVQSCRDSDRGTISAYSADEIALSKKKISGCFTCTISVSSIASGVGLSMPGLRPFFYLIRGAVGAFKNFKSPEDIPKSWNIDYNSVYRSWRMNNGSITKECMNDLISGSECLGNPCRNNLVKSFEDQHKQYVSTILVKPGDLSEVYTLKKKYKVQTPYIGCGLTNFEKSSFKEFK